MLPKRPKPCATYCQAGCSPDIWACYAHGRVIVTAMVRQRVLGVFGRTRLRSLGHLGPVIDQLLMPLIATGQELRVRVVGITPEHLSTDDGPEVFVSVWGAPGHRMRRA